MLVFDTIAYMGKKSKGFRLSEKAFDLLKRLSDEKGISEAAVLEILIREAAKKLDATR